MSVKRKQWLVNSIDANKVNEYYTFQKQFVEARGIFLNTVGMWHQKRPPLVIFFSFKAAHLKFCNNIELTIQKKRMFFVFQILAFYAIFALKMTSQSSRQILFLVLWDI